MSGSAGDAVSTVATPAASEVADYYTLQSLDTRVLGLTDVQRSCLNLTPELKSSKEIAQILGLTQHSVDWHMKAAMRKLGVGSRVAAACLLRDAVELDGRQRLARQSPEVAAAPAQGEVGASNNRWSDHDAPVTTAEIRDTGPAVEWISAEIRPDRAVHGEGRAGFDVGVPWGTLNTLRLQQRLILILLIAVLSALAFSSIVGSLEAFRPVL